jgi:hypothetical protein
VIDVIVFDICYPRFKATKLKAKKNLEVKEMKEKR